LHLCHLLDLAASSVNVDQQHQRRDKTSYGDQYGDDCPAP
jgi:hypothetical protein